MHLAREHRPGTITIFVSRSVPIERLFPFLFRLTSAWVIEITVLLGRVLSDYARVIRCLGLPSVKSRTLQLLFNGV